MSTSSRPSTPVAQSSPSTPRTGTWRHPKLDEIVQRQNATNFSERNLKKIVYNVGGIIIVFFLARSLWNMYAVSTFAMQ
jgi:nucleoporin POM34